MPQSRPPAAMTSPAGPPQSTQRTFASTCAVPSRAFHVVPQDQIHFACPPAQPEQAHPKHDARAAVARARQQLVGLRRTGGFILRRAAGGSRWQPLPRRRGGVLARRRTDSRLADSALHTAHARRQSHDETPAASAVTDQVHRGHGPANRSYWATRRGGPARGAGRRGEALPGKEHRDSCGGAMLPCCSRPRGLPGKDMQDPMIASSVPLRGEPAARRSSPSDLERDFGPNEGGGGAFLKLRGMLAESRQGAAGLPPNSRGTGPLSPALGQSPTGAGTSPAGSRSSAGVSPAHGLSPVPHGLSPTPHGQVPAANGAPSESPPGGFFGSIGSSISTLGSNLGVPLGMPAPTTPPNAAAPGSPAGILKSRDGPGLAADKTAGFGGDTQRSTVSTRPLSHRESARRCGSFCPSPPSPVQPVAPPRACAADRGAVCASACACGYWCR